MRFLPYFLIASLLAAMVVAIVLKDGNSATIRLKASHVILEPQGPKPRRFVPPNDIDRLDGLRRTEAAQEMALQRYRVVSRSYLRWRSEKLVVSGPEEQLILAPIRSRCSATGILQPVNWCWYAHAARWTERELAETKVRIKANEGREVWGRIDRYLASRGSPLAGQGKLLYEEGKRANIHPAFIVGVSRFESSLGIRGCPSNRKNIWGLAACDGRWYVPYFRTWGEAIRFFTSFVNRTWPSARTPHDFSGYCEGGCAWGSYVTSYMREAGFGNSVRMR
jgi:hypothetical protein